jgi:bifunctional ADP-heptose synthase (sugar kinase/adenylyltransferase)
MQLPSLSAARLLIVGDVMLDRYWFGDVNRISPEAPVPVVKVERSEERPGGAANVARNAAALGARVDPAVRRRRRRSRATAGGLLQADGIDVEPACAMRRSATTVKLRVIGRQQQLLRIDFENPGRATRSLQSPSSSNSSNAFAIADVGDPFRLRQGRPDAHRPHDPHGARGRQDRAGRSEGRRLPALSPALSSSRRTVGVAQVVGRWRGRGGTRPTRRRRCVTELGLEALLVTRSEEGMSLFRETGAAARADCRARGLRRERRWRYGHRDARQ